MYTTDSIGKFLSCPLHTHPPRAICTLYMFTQFLLVSTEQPMQARAVCMYMYVRSVCFITMWHFLIKALQTYNTMLVSDLLQFMPSAFIFALKCQGYPFFVNYYPTRMRKGESNRFCPSVCQYKNHQIWRSRRHSEMRV